MSKHFGIDQGRPDLHRHTTESPVTLSPNTLIGEIPFDPLHFEAGMMELLLAHQCALRSRNHDCWVFAVEVSTLSQLGLSNTVLRWMIANGLLEHKVENLCQDATEREFEARAIYTFQKNSCVVLTTKGYQLLNSIYSRGTEKRAALKKGAFEDVESTPINMIPFWDQERKVLIIQDQVVKSFRIYSPNQEAVLNAFQEESWPARIDDPLPPVANQTPKRRLHDTIKNLNKHQQAPLIRFRGDGTGEGVIWEIRGG